MSSKKEDKGKLYKKLHTLQKLFTRLMRLGRTDEIKEVEIKEKHIIEKIKGKGKHE